ncbi:hypothetical protein OC842_000355 [Tilletia horrida]|uniref:CDP-diacylglycerol--glycerol-3-phosphate 3-phosphatidyltransferase n=1 Tax=Tilletia horrida TaxID=155126 RepID=A0AAN6JMV9_9BASI|nr:hypothetical protein OC842_000355 [Tilletia horrida]
MAALRLVTSSMPGALASRTATAWAGINTAACARLAASRHPHGRYEQQQQAPLRRAAHSFARPDGPLSARWTLGSMSAAHRLRLHGLMSGFPAPLSLSAGRARSKLPQCLSFHTSATRLQEAKDGQSKAAERQEAEPIASSQSPSPVAGSEAGPESSKPKALAENIYTIPNLLTASRLLTCPIIGWQVLEGNMKTATALLFFSALTDLLDGYLARRWNSYTVFGSIADPAADKALMTVMVVTLGIKGLIPPLLAALIIGRDVGLVLTAFYIRYASLPPPKTFARYWDFSLPSASVQPTQISKYNTFLQLCLVGVSTVLPIFSPETQELCAPALTAFQWLVAGTTIWSGASYMFGRGAVTYLNRKS